MQALSQAFTNSGFSGFTSTLNLVKTKKPKCSYEEEQNTKKRKKDYSEERKRKRQSVEGALYA